MYLIATFLMNYNQNTIHDYYHDYSLTCRLPIDYDPYDSSVLKYLKNRSKQVNCGNNKPFQPLTYVNPLDGVLRQNELKYKCYYQRFWKHSDNDDQVVFDKKKLLDAKKGLKLEAKENFILVECCCPQYKNQHFWFNPQLSGKKKRHQMEGDFRPSVFILVIESMSRLNYLRYLKKTKRIIEKNLNKIFYLEGMNKLADNSFPNMVPFLTGKLLHNGELSHEDHGPYDDWPLIWKNFSKQGYVTAFIEDHPDLTLFNYLSKGFVKSAPTDFYPRPFWIHLFKTQRELGLKTGSSKPSKLCYRDRTAKIDIFLDQTYHFLQQSTGYPFFCYFFYIEITHDDFNEAQIIDSHLEKYFQKSLDLLKNDTIFILMGDHGNRYGEILETIIGRVEERMPLFAIYLPQALRKRHPNLEKYLEINRRRLTTWLDVHQMLTDIVENNYSVMAPRTEISRSYSLWREEIPFDRNCQTAKIPDLYCLCSSYLEMNQNGPLAKSISKALIDFINNLLVPYPQCQPLILDQIRSLHLIIPNNNVVQYRGFHQQFEVTILVKPSGGLFRSQLYRTSKNITWQLHNDQVTRINAYGQQSYCIAQRHIKPFCFC